MNSAIDTIKTELNSRLEQLLISMNKPTDLQSIYYNLRDISRDLDILSDYIQDLLKIIAEAV